MESVDDEAGIAKLQHGWHIGHVVPALRSRDGERVELAAQNAGMSARQRGACHWHRAGQDALHSWTGPLIRHMRYGDSCGDLQQLRRQMRRGSDARAGIAQLVWIGLSTRYQLRYRGDTGGRCRDE